jgi:hypothetical protein
MARYCLQIIGHLLAPSVLYGETHPAPSDTIQLVLWLPTFLGLTIRLLNSHWHIGINCFEYAKMASELNRSPTPGHCLKLVADKTEAEEKS